MRERPRWAPWGCRVAWVLGTPLPPTVHGHKRILFAFAQLHTYPIAYAEPHTSLPLHRNTHAPAQSHTYMHTPHSTRNGVIFFK